jgi:hypothetical protein
MAYDICDRLARLLRDTKQFITGLSPMSGPQSERKVLLAIREGHLDPRLLASARQLCQRLEAGLDILLLASGERLPAEVTELVRALRAEGVMYSLTQKTQLRRRDVVAYANTHECIATVVIDSLEGWESVAENRGSNPWLKLACPLVTAVPPKTTEND